MEKVTKAFLSADIRLYELNDKNIKNLFSDVVHSLPAKSTCRKAMLKLGSDESQRIRNAVDDELILWLLMKVH